MACESIARRSAQERYRSVLGSAGLGACSSEDTSSAVSKLGTSATQIVAPVPRRSPVSATSSMPFSSVDSTRFSSVDSMPCSSSASMPLSSVDSKSSLMLPTPLRQQDPADTCQCWCNGNCIGRHRSPCLNIKEGSSSFCATCKCRTCLKQSYRSATCLHCSKKVLPLDMLRAKSLSAFLSRLLPADIEQLLALWSTVQDNLFAQVLIAWVEEPSAMEYLAQRLNPNATPEATRQVLLEACRKAPGLTPQSLIVVGKDLSGQGVASTTKLLSAMVALGVAEGPLRTSSSPRADGMPQQAGRPTGVNKYGELLCCWSQLLQIAHASRSVHTPAVAEPPPPPVSSTAAANCLLTGLGRFAQLLPSHATE